MKTGHRFYALCRFLLLGAVVGAFIGAAAAGVLSAGRATLEFYALYAIFGIIVGLIGSIVGGLLVIGMRD